MKVEMKINRYIVKVGKDDLVLDNGACIQVPTQVVSFDGWHTKTLIMSKKLFKELKMLDFIYIDKERTEKANKGYKESWLTYYRFDIDRMLKMGYKKVEGD